MQHIPIPKVYVTHTVCSLSLVICQKAVGAPAGNRSQSLGISKTFLLQSILLSLLASTKCDPSFNFAVASCIQHRVHRIAFVGHIQGRNDDGCCDATWCIWVILLGLFLNQYAAKQATKTWEWKHTRADFYQVFPLQSLQQSGAKPTHALNTALATINLRHCCYF